MPVENVSGQIGDSTSHPFVSSDQPAVTVASEIADAANRPGVTWVVVGRHASLSPAITLDATRVLDASCIGASILPMTDAIKRVDGSLVVETVDRSQLGVVDFPLVLPADLARRWAESSQDPSSMDLPIVDDSDSRGRRLSATALLSQLVLVEPGLRVVALDHLS